MAKKDSDRNSNLLAGMGLGAGGLAGYAAGDAAFKDKSDLDKLLRRDNKLMNSLEDMVEKMTAKKKNIFQKVWEGLNKKRSIIPKSRSKMYTILPMLGAGAAAGGLMGKGMDSTFRD